MPRSYIYDAIALLGSYLAQCSHIKEHIVKLKQDKETAKTSDEASDIQNNIDKLEGLYTMIISERRRIMDKLEVALQAEPTYHCMLKHAIESFNYAIEVEDATNELWDLSTRATDILNAILSIATWNPIEFCSRCLWDILLWKSHDS